MLDKLKKAVVLLIIGSLSGGIIFGVNALTEETISDNAIAKEEGFYKEIFSIDDEVSIEFVKVEVEDGLEEVVVTLKDDGSLVGYIYKYEDKNNYGDITVLVGIQEGVISNVVISASTNTPNFVKVIEKEYLSPFTDQDVTDVTFDVKTGASYSYGSVEKIVNMATEYYNTNRGDE